MNSNIFQTSTIGPGAMQVVSNARYENIGHLAFSCWGAVYELFTQNWRQSHLSSGKADACIESIETKSYQLLKPIPVTIEVRSEDEFIASFSDAGIAIAGDSPTDAFQLLKLEIVETYAIFKKEKKLGPGPQQQLQVLEGYIGKKGGK